MSVLAGMLHLDGASGAVADVAFVEGGAAATWDHQGAWVEGPIAFGWQRRWTTPEAVSEPMPVTSADRRFVLSYAGRIDNRDELIVRYGVPSIAADGELLVTAFSRDGAAGLRHCVGDFVLAVWDRVDRRLWLARDALGHRPLFYVSDRQRVVWATDLRFLRKGAGKASRPNAGFLAEYLSRGIASRDETVFDRIRRVPPAQALSMTPDDSAFAAMEYWTPPQSLPAGRADGDLIDEFRERLSSAVRACMRARGSVAIELSGGLDSSSLAALATELSGAPPATYSMVFPGAPYTPDGVRLDETPFIDAMVAAVGAPSHRHDPRNATRDDVLRILRTYGDLPDWPNADAVRWPLVQAAAASGHRVMLTGVGGDSWLTGSVARLPAMLRHGRLFQAWRFAREALGPEGLEDLPLPMLRQIVAASAPPFAKRVFRSVRPARPWPSWLTADFVRRTGLSARLRALPARVPASADAVLRESLTRLASAEGPLLREGIFRTADDAGMEARHPFYDRRLVEFALTLPDDLRFRHGQTRYILRQAMGTRLPPVIAARRDKGDGTTLIAQALMRVLNGLSLKSLRVADAGWVNGDAVRAACAEFSEAGAPPPTLQSHHFDLWAAIAVEMWLRAIDSGAA